MYNNKKITNFIFIEKQIVNSIFELLLRILELFKTYDQQQTTNG